MPIGGRLPGLVLLAGLVIAIVLLAGVGPHGDRVGVRLEELGQKRRLGGAARSVPEPDWRRVMLLRLHNNLRHDLAVGRLKDLPKAVEMPSLIRANPFMSVCHCSPLASFRIQRLPRHKPGITISSKAWQQLVTVATATWLLRLTVVSRNPCQPKHTACLRIIQTSGNAD
ncbi:unnamed protein product [Protopolystoma xenopodis]|uniref:Uncharacterized protein n=1 Tax=Protopolystoma xenopodis TaxID=117903 RepID=A0A448XEF8_9PLAT|nr:unnamed protein product [Protopolystoma xenopodis]